MNNYFKELTLKTGRMTHKSWFVDTHGKRCSEKFRVKSAETYGPITRLVTDTGSIIYSKYSKEYKLLAPCCGFWDGVTKLADNLYLISWRGMCDSRCHFLFNAKLEPVANSYGSFFDFKMLTDELLGVQTDVGWGIIDMTGNWVEEPRYSELKVRDGKIIGKITKVVETEYEVNL